MLERKNGFTLEEQIGLNLKDGFRQISVGEFSLTTPAHSYKIRLKIPQDH